MKKLICLVVMLCGLSAVAQDQGYLIGTNTIELAEGESLIVLCVISDGGRGEVLKMDMPDGSTIAPIIRSDSDLAHRTIIGPGIVRPWFDSRRFMYKINRTEAFANPMNVIMIPADYEGDLDISLEASTDLQNWTPVYSGSAGTSNNAAFFRTRLIQN